MTLYFSYPNINFFLHLQVYDTFSPISISSKNFTDSFKNMKAKILCFMRPHGHAHQCMLRDDCCSCFCYASSPRSLLNDVAKRFARDRFNAPKKLGTSALYGRDFYMKRFDLKRRRWYVETVQSGVIKFITTNLEFK